MDKSKQRSCAVLEEPLRIYNIGQRTGPPPRKVKEVDSNTIIKEARKKNILVFVLARLHYAAHKQKTSSWTGFNIKVHDKENIVDSNVGYLPTINSLATGMSTVNEILNRSLSIMPSLDLTSITCVFDQAIYCKALEIKSKNDDTYKPVVLRSGTFHHIKLCPLLWLHFSKTIALLFGIFFCVFRYSVRPSFGYDRQIVVDSILILSRGKRRNYMGNTNDSHRDGVPTHNEVLSVTNERLFSLSV